MLSDLKSYFSFKLNFSPKLFFVFLLHHLNHSVLNSHVNIITFTITADCMFGVYCTIFCNPSARFRNAGTKSVSGTNRHTILQVIWINLTQSNKLLVRITALLWRCLHDLHDSLSGGVVCINREVKYRGEIKKGTGIAAVPVYQSRGPGSEAGEGWSVQSWGERGRPGLRMWWTRGWSPVLCRLSPGRTGGWADCPKPRWPDSRSLRPVTPCSPSPPGSAWVGKWRVSKIRGTETFGRYDEVKVLYWCEVHATLNRSG